MDDKENISEDVLEQVRDFRDLYGPASNRISKIQLNVAVGMVKGLIYVQKASEKFANTMKQHLKNHIKPRGR